ncbi:D-2-hydroxyacid dehydrogenase [Parablastomonas sp. CN1-191]|uniref:D-2-hydroxyacid dehydrogenase n=1 Tax=Parablastomonas sp. CN1-191 TaxID=3400908 RepID=UPI003BF917CB
MTTAVLSTLVRPLVEPYLPAGIEPRWYASREEMLALAPAAEIGWFDHEDKALMAEAVARAGRLRWLNTLYAGIDFLPLETLAARGVTVTNGAGINALTIAEYVVMGMLTTAKGYREVVRAQDRHEWLLDAPGKRELAGSRALLLGYGAIGKLVAERLAAFAVEVTVVRRSAAAGAIGPGEWRDRLGEFDWIVVAVPATPETDAMIGAEEIAAMRPDAIIVNIARGAVIDQDALVAALEQRRIGGAFLDVTTPEPLPADHPLWSLDNAHVTMHLSGRSQTQMFQRTAARFVRNLAAWEAGSPLEHVVDLARGY